MTRTPSIWFAPTTWSQTKESRGTKCTLRQVESLFTKSSSCQCSGRRPFLDSSLILTAEKRKKRHLPRMPVFSGYGNKIRRKRWTTPWWKTWSAGSANSSSRTKTIWPMSRWQSRATSPRSSTSSQTRSLAILSHTLAGMTLPNSQYRLE